MKLLNDIVALLMNEGGSLNEALLKTKVLLHDIGQRELVGWVNSELRGYSPDAELPPYRVVGIQLYGNVTNGVYTYQRRKLSARHLRDQYGDVFEVARLRQAIDVFEKFVTDATLESALTSVLGFGPDKLLSKPFQDGYYVEGSYTYIGVGQVRQILVEVRSRLLDFILELRGEIGGSTPEDQVKERANQLDVPAMFDRTVFGDNTTFVFGSGNNTQITNSVIKNDKAAVAAELRKNGVEEEDIVALDVALTEDPIPTVPGQYGPAVQSWMKRMLGKAVDTTWNIKVGAAGSLLATVIQKYYGL